MKRVTEEGSPECEKCYGKRRLINVPECKMVRAGDIIELIPEVAVTAVEHHHEEKRRSSDEERDPQSPCGHHGDNRESHADFLKDETDPVNVATLPGIYKPEEPPTSRTRQTCFRPS